MTTWQPQKAKAHFSKLVKKATNEGPQTITIHGKPKISLVELLTNSPLHGVKLNITRDKSLNREVELEF